VRVSCVVLSPVRFSQKPHNIPDASRIKMASPGTLSNITIPSSPSCLVCSRLLSHLGSLHWQWFKSAHGTHPGCWARHPHRNRCSDKTDLHWHQIGRLPTKCADRILLGDCGWKHASCFPSCDQVWGTGDGYVGACYDRGHASWKSRINYLLVSSKLGYT
jgi:hypothetical protein